MFCSAVPTVVALGLAAYTEQQRKNKEALARGEPPPRPVVPAGKATVAALAAIAVAATIYHTQGASM